MDRRIVMYIYATDWCCIDMQSLVELCAACDWFQAVQTYRGRKPVCTGTVRGKETCGKAPVHSIFSLSDTQLATMQTRQLLQVLCVTRHDQISSRRLIVWQSN